ncbi:hypothetical protein [Acidicapsa acidisoli]|uniref:hypothetical protein n=1 Tax=Acidicapsa acidisoli TaxID=1615681 RepID=UPI0021E06B67|nr:hypothetical protein [Acidicapsa acidisoli]
MTDINKAIAFAKECLKWDDPLSVVTVYHPHVIIDQRNIERTFVPALVGSSLDGFLGKRFFIQINRGTTSLFKWRVMIGLQDISKSAARYDHAQAESDDLYDAIFDACVAAARLYGDTDY